MGNVYHDTVNYSLYILKNIPENLTKSADKIGKCNKEYEAEVNRLNESWTTPSGKKMCAKLIKFKEEELKNLVLEVKRDIEKAITIYETSKTTENL